MKYADENGNEQEEEEEQEKKTSLENNIKKKNESNKKKKHVPFQRARRSAAAKGKHRGQAAQTTGPALLVRCARRWRNHASGRPAKDTV
jgi:hypothetical protein